MKYFKKTNTYKNSTGTLTLDMNSGLAHSYDWYRLAERLDNGQWLVNSYSYSNTTMKHRSQVLRLLNYNCINLEAPKGLQNLDAAIEHYNYLINKEQDKLDNNRVRPHTKEKARININTYQNKIEFIKALQAGKQ